MIVYVESNFINPDIDTELRAQSCRLLTRFGDALGYIRSHRSGTDGA